MKKSIELSNTKKAILKKSINRINKKFSQESETMTEEDYNELKQIELIIGEIEIVDEQNATEKSKQKITITNSVQEDWYRAMFKQWGLRHEGFGEINSLSNSGIYKFTLRFFVDTIVLNPANAGLSYGEVLNRVNNINRPSEMDKKIAYSLNDIKELVSLQTSMSLFINQQDLNSPLRKFSPELVQHLTTEINPNSDLGYMLNQYKKNRDADKQKRKTDFDM